MANKTARHSKKTLLLGILLPIAGLGVVGGATVGVLYATGVLGHQVVSIADIFTDGSNPYQWSNTATAASGTGTQGTGAGSFGNMATAEPSVDAIKDNLQNFLTRAGKTNDAIINDLAFESSPLWSSVVGNELKTTVTTIPNQDRYTGSFEIHIFVSATHELATDITSHIISVESTTPTASDAASVLKTNNSNLDMEAIQFGYINSSSQFVPYFDAETGTDTNLSQSILNNFWTNYDVDSKTGSAYSLAVHAKPDGYYGPQADVVVYLSLARIAYNTTTFFGSSTPTLGNNGTTSVPFTVTPTLAQAKSSWINAYSGITSPFNYANFYTSNPENVVFTFESGKLRLTYGGANQFYEGGYTDFTLLVTTPKALSDVFKSTDADPVLIANDTQTNPLKYWSSPSSTTPTYQDWLDLKGLLLDRYTGASWAAFRAADFTSMYASAATITGSGTSLKGTITVSPIGSIFYIGTVTITWQVWNYQAP